MTGSGKIAKRLLLEEISFLATNRIPRRLAAKTFARLSQVRNRHFTRAAIAVWRRFADLDLADSRLQRFESLHACFTRELKPGARPVDSDPRVLTSPCDAIVVACGSIAGDTLLQAKGSTYRLPELLVSERLAKQYVDGTFATLRLTPSMYHRFHAPHDCTVARVSYVPGDTWNVNPATLARVPRLYCRNERAVVETVLHDGGWPVTLVPVAAILVASIRFRFLDTVLDMDYRGEQELPCATRLSKGEEMGWFEHGSTIIVLAPNGFTLAPPVREGSRIRMGQPLMRLP